MKVTDETVLFTEAVNVMNNAIKQNRDSFPYKQIVDATQGVAKDRKIGVAVYAEDQENPHDYYTVSFNDGQIEILSHGKDEPDIAWKVPRSYLEKVAANPDTYTQNPAKLDWDWLLTRLGIAGP